RTPMGAMVLDQPNLSALVAEQDEVLAQNPHKASRLFGRQLLRRRDRMPVAPQQLTGGRSRPAAGYQLVLFLRKHRFSSNRLSDGVSGIRAGTGSAVACTLALKLLSSGSSGVSTRAPIASIFPPEYTQRMPCSSLRPKNS